MIPQPYSFAVPHALALAEDKGLICVADRENGRVQCFRSDNGTFALQIHSPVIGPRLFSVAYSPVQGIFKFKYITKSAKYESKWEINNVVCNRKNKLTWLSTPHLNFFFVIFDSNFSLRLWFVDIDVDIIFLYAWYQNINIFLIISGGRLYLVNGPEYSSRPIRGFVIDIESKAILSEFGPNNKDFSNPHDIAVTKDGKEVYVVELDPYKVHKFVDETLTEQAAVPVKENIAKQSTDPVKKKTANVTSGSAKPTTTIGQFK